MKILLAAFFCFSTVGAASALDFSGYVSSWKQDCTSGCVPPVGSSGEAAAFVVDVPTIPGEARVAKFEQTFVFVSGEKIRATFTVYYVCPADAMPELDGDACPARYVQVQAALTGDARAYCAASLNPADAHPFPVMMCAGENVRRPGERLGVTLSRKALKASSIP